MYFNEFLYSNCSLNRKGKAITESNLMPMDSFVSQIDRSSVTSQEYEIEEVEDEDEEVEVKVNKMCFWRANSQTRIKWDLFIILLATINSFQIPYNVAFTSPENKNIALDIFNWLIDFFFMMDVVINFRTSYISDITGNEIVDTKIIAIKYLKTRFWIDLLASVPLDFFTYILNNDKSNAFLLQMLGLLKLVRILRLSRLITYLNFKNDVKMSLKLIKLVFFLVLYLHCLCCIWYFIVKQDKNWIPPLDYVYVTTNLWERSNFHKYTVSASL